VRFLSLRFTVALPSIEALGSIICGGNEPEIAGSFPTNDGPKWFNNQRRYWYLNFLFQALFVCAETIIHCQ
jgi:hypothetical protein